MLGFIFGMISVGLLSVAVGELNEQHDALRDNIQEMNDIIAKNNEELNKLLR